MKKLIYAHKTIISNLIIPMLILTSLLSLVIGNLMIIWFLMEINNFIFMIYLCLYLKNKKVIFLNFFIQILSSSILMLSILIFIFINQMNNPPPNMFLMSSALVLKLGAPPLHFWLPVTSMHMPWTTLMIFLTVQKIIPFVFISMINLNPTILNIIVIMCMFIPPFMMLNSTNLKNLIALSSINQSGWMILLIYLTTLIWIIYMFTYSLSLAMLLMTIKMYKTDMKMSTTTIKKSFKLIFLFSMMNIAGLPPFSLFIIKWYSILMFMNLMNLYTLGTIMLISSLIMMYIYINMLCKFSLTYLPISKIYTLYSSPHNLSPLFMLNKGMTMIIILTMSPIFIVI